MDEDIESVEHDFWVHWRMRWIPRATWLAYFVVIMFTLGIFLQCAPNSFTERYDGNHFVLDKRWWICTSSSKQCDQYSDKWTGPKHFDAVTVEPNGAIHP